MIRKVMLGALLWTALLTLLHVQLNIGWDGLNTKVKVIMGLEREQMLVGFLPVT